MTSSYVPLDKKDLKDRSCEYFKQALTMEDQKNLQDAIDLYTKSINDAPRIDAYYRRGSCRYALKLYKEAQEDFLVLIGKAKELDQKKHRDSLFILGMCSLLDCKYPEAIQYFAEASTKPCWSLKDKEQSLYYLELTKKRYEVILVC